jgi:hypothetical protein
MSRTTVCLFLLAMLAPAVSHALSPEASEGEAFFPACHVCHNPSLEPPLGPPMWAVQRRYRNASLDREDFVERIIAFVKAPSLEQALITPAVERLGLMPALPLPDDMLRKIATYIWEADFAPPCEHWRNAARWAESTGDAAHAVHDAQMLQRFCSEQP